MRFHFSPLAAGGGACLDTDLRSWTTSDGVMLNVQHWQPPEAPPRAVLIAVHGLCGAATDFTPLGEHFQKEDVSTFSFDLRSQAFDPDERSRGHLRDFRLLVRDVSEFCTLIAARHPQTPVILFGESMGGMLSILATTHGPALPVDLLILDAPVVGLHIKPALWQTALLNILAGIAPRLRINPESFKPQNAPPVRLTRDDAYEEFLKAAPQQMRTFTLGFLSNLKRMMETADRSASLLRHPCLVLYAEHDIFVPPAVVENFFDRIPHPAKSRIFYPGNYHLLLHDLDSDKVLRDTGDWLSAQLPACENSAQ